MTIVIGAVFSWLRIRSESVWPAALAHGAFNAAAGFSLETTILGWTGWLVPLVLVIVLLVTGQFRAPAPRDSELPAESASLAGSE